MFHRYYPHWFQKGGVSLSYLVLETRLIDSNAMLKLAAEKGIKPILDEILPMSKAGDAVEKVKNNTVRYRFVLKQDLE